MNPLCICVEFEIKGGVQNIIMPAAQRIFNTFLIRPRNVNNPLQSAGTVYGFRSPSRRGRTGYKDIPNR